MCWLLVRISTTWPSRDAAAVPLRTSYREKRMAVNGRKEKLHGPMGSLKCGFGSHPAKLVEDLFHRERVGIDERSVDAI